MKIVKLKGGLGNQMFQYAFAKLLEKRSGCEVKIDLSPYLELNGDLIRKPRILKFNISLSIASKEDINSICKLSHTGNSQTNKYRIGIALEYLFNRRYFFERNHHGCTVQEMLKYDFFDGYWQNWNYIDEIIDELREEFTPVNMISEHSQKELKLIESCDSICVGVRRGDYLTSEPKHYGTMNMDYYERAMYIIEQKIKEPTYFIFSNDVNWVKKNMIFPKKNIVYITDTVDDFEDLILMSKCKHSIIPNSTFHWWGARLNEHRGKTVIAPSKWFADDAKINILPERWERV